MDIPKNGRSFTIVDGPDSKGFFQECEKSFAYKPFGTRFRIIYKTVPPEGGEPVREPMAIESFRIEGYEQTGFHSLKFRGSCKANPNGNSRTGMKTVFFTAEYDPETGEGRIFFGK